MSTKFHQVEINQKFKLVAGGTTTRVFVKSSKAGAHHDGAFYPINSQAAVVLVEDEATVTSEDQTLIEKIIERAVDNYGADRVKPDRLRKALLCAHRVKPIRLNDLLNTCRTDFFYDVFDGAYRRYDEATDTLRDGWTAQHAEPKRAWWE